MSSSAKSSPAHSLNENNYLCMEDGDNISAALDQTIITGWLKFRDQKKSQFIEWKLRYGVVTKLSPAADCLHLQLYRDSKDRFKQGATKASLSLEHFLGIESGFTLDKESNTIAIICRDIVVVLAFDTRERLIQWQIKINYNLGDDLQFLVQISSIPMRSKVNLGPAILHMQNYNFCLTSGNPPKLIGYWEIKHLRKYGVVDGKYCFEGGSLCGKWEGLYILLTDESQEIAWNMQIASKGRLTPKRRQMTRNMSVMESPSRKGLQHLQDSHISGLDSLFSHPSKKPSACNYEWASVDSSILDTNAEGFSDEEYNTICRLKDFEIDWKVTNFLQTSEGNSKEVVCENIPATEEIKHDVPPERPPKPAKYRNKDDLATKKVEENEENSNKLGVETTKEVVKRDEHMVMHNSCQCHCCSVHNKQDDRITEKEISNYDIPPPAVPVHHNVCSCATKMRLIVESQECPTVNRNCPCSHMITCWPYNWFQLAYCRPGNTIQETSIFPCKLETSEIIRQSTEAALPNYAKIDLSKKTKYRNPSFDENQQKCVEGVSQQKSNSADDCKSNNCYTNLYFENSLKYYENAKEFRSLLVSETPEAVKQLENYIIMNPVSTMDDASSDMNKHVLVHNNRQSEETETRQRSCSLDSNFASEGDKGLGRYTVLVKNQDPELAEVTKCSYNRDSSSSNDSGFSVGSMKLQGSDQETFAKGRNNSFSSSSSTISSKPIRSTSDPLKDISFRFQRRCFNSKSIDEDIAECHRNIYSNKDTLTCKNEGARSIPYIDSQSTSSETSDISDYIETLSFSSQSSSERTSKSKRLNVTVSTLKPRSGKEYDNIDKNLITEEITKPDF